MLVDPLEPGVKSYLAAIDAAALYISADHNIPMSVGCGRDPHRIWQHLVERISPTVEFAWIVWGKREPVFWLATTPGIMVTDQEGVRKARTVEQLIDLIERMARERDIGLTPHQTVIERARRFSGYIDEVMVELRVSGQLSAFNYAYKRHRLDAKSRGESVEPYWANLDRLRRIIIRALVERPHEGFDLNRIKKQIGTQFPWLRVNHGFEYAEAGLTNPTRLEHPSRS